MKIGVLGLGNWGTALAQHFASCGYDVLAYNPDQVIVDHFNTEHRHQKYLTDIKINSKIVATTDITALENLPLVFLVIPAKALAAVFEKFKPAPQVALVSTIKGLEPNTLLTPLQYLEQQLELPNSLAVLSGPSFAADVARQLPAGLVAASKDENLAQQIASQFSNQRMKIYVSNDTIGVEIGGIAKNVIAIAVGVSDALQLGDSARAALITRGLSEMTRFAVALGADAKTLAGLSGLGDLVLTATSDTSRNRTVGLRLGAGESLADILADLGSTSEGVASAPIIAKIAAEKNIDMPISNQVNKLIIDKITPQEMTEQLLTRPVKRENA